MRALSPSRPLPLLALTAGCALPLFAAACADPVGDKPRAEVKEAAPAPAPTAAPDADKGGYAFSEAGSKLGFVGAKVTGTHDGAFNKFKGTITAPDGKVESAKVDVTIDMSSVTTDNERLTGHLKSPDFFDVAQFPTARFTSTRIEPKEDGTARVTGNLTLHGMTKQISFPATVMVSGDSATAKAEFGINRKDFGIVYAGKPDDLIRDEVLLKLDIQGKK